MFRKVLFPTDFSKGSIRAIQRFEKENTAEVEECILLHVIDEGYIEDLLNGYSFMYESEKKEMNDVVSRAKENAIKALKEREEEYGRMLRAKRVRSVVRIGIPYEEIVKFADDENVSMILLPSHGKLGYSKELLGSTTIRVLRRTKRPVLIIKTHEED